MFSDTDKFLPQVEILVFATACLAQRKAAFHLSMQGLFTISIETSHRFYLSCKARAP
jgi:hypothetical protein